MSWAQTAGGSRFELFQERPRFTADDVCYGLGRQTRFCGQYSSHVPFYSVAEHSILIVEYMDHVGGFDDRQKRTAAMHDAPEFILGDLVRPVKRECPAYSGFEERVAACMAERFDLFHPIPKWLKDLDDRMLAKERRTIIAPGDAWEIDGLAPLNPVRFRFWLPSQAVVEYRRVLERLGVKVFDSEVGLCV